MVRNNCYICGNGIWDVGSFGNIYISNFIGKEEKSEDYPKSDLSLFFCSQCKSAQLDETVDPNVLYKKYWYYSGINATMRDALSNVVNSVREKINYNTGDIWLDIACNDGTLLSSVPDQFETIGIDPADQDIINLARQKVDYVINDYFSKDAYFGKIDKKAKVITCIAMFYDLKNPVGFAKDMYDCLADDGLIVLQMSYTPLMLNQFEFGNVCAEHVMYHSLTSMSNILLSVGLSLVDVELNDVNGGSFRLYITKKGRQTIYGNQQQRDVGNMRLQQMYTYEEDTLDSYSFEEFMNNIYHLKNSTVDFIRDAVKRGRKVYAYGASTKGNMLLQYFGLDNTLITKIADRNSQKWGLKTIGTEIPICSEEEMRKDNPDYLLILPWYFINEFKERERDYLDGGGRFIVPCPKFEII
jgi:NDP-4-keto-2,6-dideoxyhexose 3-C-methyltransferase